ncbi:hypothetical protein LX77_00102 [Gelidibacter algens]|jgi:hypothetical protein|uniref:Uncharacterized protein n=1 Tax=Gelidibacter algens TaxID=49280 RepID=A0A1A7R013_9FLAO|nr:hypothetical protein [Gelidibacter algens]OBX24868.1 hypothetical protein A9996_12800 [Gelidibacter algens]RAJ27530.1 hypothetical protein LX77_00102 [Gelidibacter algens]
MKQNRQYLIDLWLFIGSITVLLYLLLMNIMFAKNWSNVAIEAIMELITIPILSAGAFIPLIVIFRIVLKRMFSRALAILTMLFSLLTAVLIGYTSLL